MGKKGTGEKSLCYRIAGGFLDLTLTGLLSTSWHGVKEAQGLCSGLVHVYILDYVIYNHCTVFQLGIFLRALRPARTGLLRARLSSAQCPNYLLFLCFQTADVKMLVTACRFVPMFSSIAHKIVPRPRFIRVLDCDKILVVHA